MSEPRTTILNRKSSNPSNGEPEGCMTRYIEQKQGKSHPNHVSDANVSQAHEDCLRKVKEILKKYPDSSWVQAFQLLDQLMSSLRTNVSRERWMQQTLSDCLVLLSTHRDLWREANLRSRFFLRCGEVITENGMSACILSVRTRKGVLLTSRLCAAEGLNRIRGHVLWYITDVLNRPIEYKYPLSSRHLSLWSSALSSLQFYQSSGSGFMMAMWHALIAKNSTVSERLRIISRNRCEPLTFQVLKWLGEDAGAWIAPKFVAWEQTLHLLKREYTGQTQLNHNASLPPSTALALLELACTAFPHTSYPHFMLSKICNTRRLSHRAVCRALALIPVSSPTVDRVHRYVKSLKWKRIPRKHTDLQHIEAAGQHLLQCGMWKIALKLCSKRSQPTKAFVEALCRAHLLKYDSLAAYLALKVATSTTSMDFPSVKLQDAAHRLFRAGLWQAGVAMMSAVVQGTLLPSRVWPMLPAVPVKVVMFEPILLDEAAAHAFRVGRWDVATQLLAPMMHSNSASTLTRQQSSHERAIVSVPCVTPDSTLESSFPIGKSPPKVDIALEEWSLHLRWRYQGVHRWQDALRILVEGKEMERLI